MAAAEREGEDAVSLALAEESLQRAERAQALAEERGADAEDAAALSVFVGTWNLAGEVRVVTYVASG